MTFIDLSGYAELFDDLSEGFPEPAAASMDAMAPPMRGQLAVVTIGSFEASFVPAIKDFDRLDARFRLPADVWSQLPGYENFGFAVFKLKKDYKQIHPMAFAFPRADPDMLFFPTVHIHDGKVHAESDFDHALFCQRSPRTIDALADAWNASCEAKHFVDIEKARGMLDGERLVYRLRIRGPAPNRDFYLND